VAGTGEWFDLLIRLMPEAQISDKKALHLSTAEV
jgi:hypothetical protein